MAQKEARAQGTKAIIAWEAGLSRMGGLWGRWKGQANPRSLLLLCA